MDRLSGPIGIPVLQGREDVNSLNVPGTTTVSSLLSDVGLSDTTMLTTLLSDAGLGGTTLGSLLGDFGLSDGTRWTGWRRPWAWAPRRWTSCSTLSWLRLGRRTQH